MISDQIRIERKVNPKWTAWSFFEKRNKKERGCVNYFVL